MQISANCPLPVIAYGLVGHKIDFSHFAGLWVHKVARGDGVNVRVKIQAITRQVNGTQDARPESLINGRSQALSLGVHSRRQQIQKARVYPSCKK